MPDLPWAEVRVPSPALLQRVHQELSAGAGEEETLALAVELGATVVLDDLKARRYAQRVGLSFTGTLGLLVEIHKRGLASRSAGEDLDLLERGGMRLTPALQLRVLTCGRNEKGQHSLYSPFHLQQRRELELRTAAGGIAPCSLGSRYGLGTEANKDD